MEEIVLKWFVVLVFVLLYHILEVLGSPCHSCSVATIIDHLFTTRYTFVNFDPTAVSVRAERGGEGKIYVIIRAQNYTSS